MTAPSASAARFGRAASRVPDLVFRLGTGGFAWVVVGIVVLVGILLAATSTQVFEKFGLSFLTGSTWDPVASVYGALPFIVGTLLSSLIAIVLAAPIGILTAIFLAELAPRRVAIPLTFAVELLAAIPSVVYGLWGVFILGPFLASTVDTWLHGALGWIPIFAGTPDGVGLFSAGVILTLMILPTIVAISRDVITAVPDSQREAMLALGATRWEMITKSVLPYARSGVYGALILGLGRALGETMAVTMVIGNRSALPKTIFDSSQTIASQIATTFSEAGAGLPTSALIGLGLVLLVITMSLNIVARLLVWRVAGPGTDRR
ncbi:MAG: phosphate transport system permease protein [Chloroflexota bacterium]|jgi:phosphate transport system permease protein|nr:phosphate transport system permease protein [Chloroflexota bacterium]